MRTAIIVGASTVGAAAAGFAGFKVYKGTVAGPAAPPEVSAVLKGNEKLLSKKELALIKDLLDRGQAHLFAAWPAPGTQDALKRKLVAQLVALNNSYHGGICAYIDNAKKLLQDSKEGRNPFEGYTPSVPHGEKLDFGSPDFMDLEKEGLAQAGATAFVLVAGGLGERLGYSGIKVALPCESASGWCFLELYCRYIKALQVASGTGKKLPFAIMTSDDTHARTVALLEQHKYFGLDKHQVHLVKQEKVACLVDNDAHLALDPADSYAIQTKPHGHGDVHALLHSSGLAKKWHSQGLKWVAFFQDTNAQVFRALTAALGVSARHDYDMNSLAVPRKAKEAIGAIACLKHVDGSTLTINVEYNQLDPLLRGTVNPQGDVNDATGWSPYPGNINQLVLKLDSYVHQLQRTGGVISEFVNPKYKDATKTEFKSSTRLECMMQDYPKALPAGSKVGFTTVNQVWASYSPVKNNPQDALAKAKAGDPTHSATTGELDIYKLNCHLLSALAGASVATEESAVFNGIPVTMTPRVVLAPEFAPVLSAVKDKVVPGSISLSQGSVLILDGQDITVQGPLQVQGALVIRSVPGAKVKVGALSVRNAGWTWQPIQEGAEAREEDRIRGFHVVKTETSEYVFDKPGEYTVGEQPATPAPTPAGAQTPAQAPPTPTAAPQTVETTPALPPVATPATTTAAAPSKDTAPSPPVTPTAKTVLSVNAPVFTPAPAAAATPAAAPPPAAAEAVPAASSSAAVAVDSIATAAGEEEEGEEEEASGAGASSAAATGNTGGGSSGASKKKKKKNKKKN